MYRRCVPSKYTRNTALPLRVPAELRADVDALVAALPRGLSLPRNAVAVAALLRGVAELRAALVADPFAVHRALAAVEGDHQVPASTPGQALSGVSAADAPTARGNGGTRAPGAAPEPSRGSARRRPSDEGPVDRAAERSRPRAATAKAPRRAAVPSTEPEAPDAPPPDAVRELLATVLDRDRAVKPGSRGWTVKALAAALGVDRKALQSFRADGTGMGRARQLRLWEALQRDPPVKG